MATLGAENPYRVYSVAGTALGPFSTSSGGGGFTYQDPTEVVVIIQRPGLPPLTLAYLTGYTLTPAAPSTETAGGTVNLTVLPAGLSAWPAGAQVCLVRMALRTQPYDLSATIPVNQTSLRKRLDALTRQSQDRQRDILRAVAVPFGEAAPGLPAESVRADKIAGFTADGKDWQMTRTFTAFDGDVAATAANRAAAETAKNLAQSAQSGAEGARLSAENALDAVILLADNVDAATLESIEAIAQNYQNVRDALTAREISSLGAIDDAKTTAQAAIAADLADAQSSIAADKQAAIDAAAAAEAALASIVPLPARVSALENPLNITAFSASTPVAEVGATVAITLTWTLSQNPVSQSIDQGIGTVTPVTDRSTAAGSVTVNKSWVLTVSNGYTSKTATASVAFRRKRYFGVTTKAPGVAMTSAEVLLLASNEFATGYARSGMVFDCTGGRYPVICYPQSFGAPTEVFVGGFASSDFTVETLTVTNASGDASTYNILRLNTLQNGNAIGVSL